MPLLEEEGNVLLAVAALDQVVIGLLHEIVEGLLARCLHCPLQKLRLGACSLPLRVCSRRSARRALICASVRVISIRTPCVRRGELRLRNSTAEDHRSAQTLRDAPVHSRSSWNKDAAGGLARPLIHRRADQIILVAREGDVYTLTIAVRQSTLSGSLSASSLSAGQELGSGLNFKRDDNRLAQGLLPRSLLRLRSRDGASELLGYIVIDLGERIRQLLLRRRARH